MRGNSFWKELHRHREEIIRKLESGGRRATRRASWRREPAAPKAAKILLRGTGTGDTAGPRHCRKMSRAVVQSLLHFGKPLSWLRQWSACKDRVDKEKFVYNPFLLLLHLNLKKKKIDLLYCLLKP